jgi:hypothetical protein
MMSDNNVAVEDEFESTSITLESNQQKTGNVKRKSSGVPQHCSKAQGLDNFELFIKSKGAPTDLMLKTKRQQYEKTRIFAQQQHRYQYQKISPTHYTTAVVE